VEKLLRARLVSRTQHTQWLLLPENSDVIDAIHKGQRSNLGERVNFLVSLLFLVLQIKSYAFNLEAAGSVLLVTALDYGF
jgi:hypothetical protein